MVVEANHQKELGHSDRELDRRIYFIIRRRLRENTKLRSYNRAGRFPDRSFSDALAR